MKKESKHEKDDEFEREQSWSEESPVKQNKWCIDRFFPGITTAIKGKINEPKRQSDSDFKIARRHSI